MATDASQNCFTSVKHRYLKKRLGRFSLFLLLLWGAVILFGTPATAFAASAPSEHEKPTARPSGLISRGVPAFSSSGNAADGNSASYATYFNESVPGWLAYDLSSVPKESRKDVIVAYFNDTVTYPYDHALVGQVGYDNLGSYTIEANRAHGGATAAPDTGWVTLATVTNNTLHSRQSLVHMSGYNWLRINITQSDGSVGNFNGIFKMDVYDARQALKDDWLFLGDSITANIMHHGLIGTTGNFSQLINAALPDRFPLQEDAGIGGVKSVDGAAHILDWLPLFPGKFVALNYGTNDAGFCIAPAVFQQNMTFMVNAVLAAHKVPIIPHIPWAIEGSIQSCGPALNAVLDQMYKANRHIVPGPDFWGLFQNHPELFADTIHPNATGNVLYRQALVQTMLIKVYAHQEED